MPRERLIHESLFHRMPVLPVILLPDCRDQVQQVLKQDCPDFAAKAQLFFHSRPVLQSRRDTQSWERVLIKWAAKAFFFHVTPCQLNQQAGHVY